VYFNGRPKETREDLYDREEELQTLRSSLSEPIVLLTGIRRIGKTSILKVLLNEVDIPYALMDVRLPLSSYKSLYSTFSEILTQLNRKERVKHVLQGIKGVSVFGLSVSLSWDHDSRTSLIQLMDRVCEVGRAIIAFDEAQNMRGKLGYEVLALLAHSYDYCKNISFILTGSELGLLYDFLRLDDPSSPLYGRHIEEVRVGRFNADRSLDFLERGFQQYNMRAPRDTLEYTVDKLDGIVGWLTEFGHRCVRIGEVRKEVVDEVLELAIRTVQRELSRFSKLNLVVIEAISNGYERWSEIKEYLERKSRRPVYDAELRRYLASLEKRGYISRIDRGKYAIVDPVVKNAFSKSQRRTQL
jgi:AAA+ ATPase superfamily predicted ATPase